jgi:transposase
MKFVTPLNEDTRKELERIHHDDTSFKRRIRAQAILLNNRGYRLDALADIFVVDRDTVSQWITNWEEHAFDGLSDTARPGRPRKTSAEEDTMLLHEVEQHPQQISVAIGELKKKRLSSVNIPFAAAFVKLATAISAWSSVL